MRLERRPRLHLGVLEQDRSRGRPGANRLSSGAHPLALFRRRRRPRGRARATGENVESGRPCRSPRDGRRMVASRLQSALTRNRIQHGDRPEAGGEPAAWTRKIHIPSSPVTTRTAISPPATPAFRWSRSRLELRFPDLLGSVVSRAGADLLARRSGDPRLPDGDRLRTAPRSSTRSHFGSS